MYYIVCHKVPCSIASARCHANSVCTNHFFQAKCVCVYGYSGDGVNYCDGELAFARECIRFLCCVVVVFVSKPTRRDEKNERAGDK